MKRLKKQKRVSWAKGAKFCQVKFFLMEDCPTQIGLRAQHNSQLKSSPLLNINSMGSYKRLTKDPNLLKRKLEVNTIKGKPRHIPKIKWEFPPKFTLDPKWCVATGEESQEADVQRKRLESVYQSPIPSSPSGSLYVDDYHDDSKTPLIRLTPIEEEEEESLPKKDTSAPLWTTASSKLDQPKDMVKSADLNKPHFNPPESSLKQPASEVPACGTLPTIEGERNPSIVAAGAALAVTAYLMSKDEGHLIDPDLLIQLLNQPETVEKLISKYATPANIGSEPASMLNEVKSSSPLPTLRTNQVIKTNMKGCGVPANTGVPLSHEPPLRVATIPIRDTSSRPVLQATTGKGAGMSLPNTMKPSVSLTSSSKPDLEMMKVTSKYGENLVDTELLIQLLSQPETTAKLMNENGAPPNTGREPVSMLNEVKWQAPWPSSKSDYMMMTKINENCAPATAGVHLSGPKAMTPSLSFPRSDPELEMLKLTKEPVTPLVVTTIPTWSRSYDPVLIERRAYFESAKFGGSTVVAPSVPLPNSEPDVLKIRRLINEYGGAPDGTGIETSSMSPLLPYSVPKTDFSDSLRPANRHMRPLSSNMIPPLPFSRGTTPAPMDVPKLTAPKFPSPSSRTDTFVHSRAFAGATPPPVKHNNYFTSLINQHEGRMQGTLLHNRLGGPELVQNNNLNATMQKQRQKPCMYFNSPRGCRNGSTCQFQHILSDRPWEPSQAPGTKRMKPDGMY